MQDEPLYIMAKYNGRCGRCGERIYPGDLIRRNDENEWVSVCCVGISDEMAAEKLDEIRLIEMEYEEEYRMFMDDDCL